MTELRPAPSVTVHEIVYFLPSRQEFLDGRFGDECQILIKEACTSRDFCLLVHGFTVCLRSAEPDGPVCAGGSGAEAHLLPHQVHRPPHGARPLLPNRQVRRLQLIIALFPGACCGVLWSLPPVLFHLVLGCLACRKQRFVARKVRSEKRGELRNRSLPHSWTVYL